MSTDQIDPMSLAREVAASMGTVCGTWTAQPHPYRGDCALIVDNLGVSVALEIMGQGVSYARANERGKVRLRHFARPELGDHYAYGEDRPETMVTATRGARAMASAVHAKVVKRARELDEEAKRRRAVHEADVAAVQETTARLTAALAGAREVRQPGDGRGRQDRQRLAAYLGSSITGGIVDVDVMPRQVDLELKYLTPEQAERVLDALVPARGTN